MKNYLVKSSHTITKDDFNEGQTEEVNWYDLEYKVKAKTPEEAVLNYINQNLYVENTDFQKDEFCGWYLDNLVDADNMMPSQEDKNLWAERKKTLYNDYTTFEVYELIHKNPIKELTTH